jgi:hypothetical protein
MYKITRPRCYLTVLCIILQYLRSKDYQDRAGMWKAAARAYRESIFFVLQM